MKAISASVIVLSGAALLCVGSTVHDGTQPFIYLCGVVVGIIGLAGWMGIMAGVFNEK